MGQRLWLPVCRGKVSAAIFTAPPPRLASPPAVVSADGSFFKANYARGGEALRVAYAHFVAGGAGAGGAGGAPEGGV